MKPFTFTEYYTEWLQSFRAMFPGGSHAAPATEPTPKQAQVAANQEWEDEGGTVKPEKKPDVTDVANVANVSPAPKMPL